MRNVISAGLLAAFALGVPGMALAQAINPFSSDGCVPGFTAEGTFVDEAGNVLDSTGWVAVAAGEVLDSLGNRVLLRRNCLAGLTNTAATTATTGLAAGTASVFVVGLGVVLLGANGTNGTNGTN